MPDLNNNFSFGNYNPKCVTQIIGDSYFVTISDVTTRIRGMQVPMPVFAPPSYNDMCVFNNTDRIIEIKYKTVDNTEYFFVLPPGEFYNHHSDSFINNNSVNIRSTNGEVTFGQFDIYFNFDQIPTTTTQTSTTSTSTSTNSSSSSSTNTSSTTSTSTTTESIFPSALNTFNNWDFSAPSQRILVYTPSGYNPADTSKLYPWAIYLHSEGEYGAGDGPAGIEKLYRSGPTKFLYEGDRPSEYIIIAPQIPNGSWTDAKVGLARAYALANYRVDPSKLTMVGTSIGGTGVGNYVMSNPDKVAAYIIATGTIGNWADSGIPINGVRPADVPGYFLAGVQDSVVSALTGPTYLDFANGLTPKPRYPFLTHLIWGGVHARSVWDDNLYNRKYRTDEIGTAKIDWIEEIGKRYKIVDYVFNATKKVEAAEPTIDLNKYLEALRLVGQLPASTAKTNLQNRLGVVATNIKNNHRNFILSFGSTPALNGPYNSIPAPVGISAPLVDILGLPSPYTFNPITMNWTTTTSVPVGLDNDYLGFDTSFHETAFKCLNAGNKWRLANLKPNKLYNIRVYYADKSQSTSDRGGGIVTISGITKQSDAQIYNTHRYIEFTNINAINGYIELTLSSYMTSQSLDVTGLLLTELLNSNVVISSTTSTSTTTLPLEDFDFNVDFSNLYNGENFEFYFNLESI